MILKKDPSQPRLSYSNCTFMACRFSKMILKKDPSQPRLQMKGPPKSFFEADGPDIEDSDHRIPSEVLYMLRSVR